MYLIVLSFIGLGSLLVWYLLYHDHGRKLPVGSLWTAFGFGVLAMVVAGIGEFYLLPTSFLHGTQATALGTKLLGSLGVGFLEEAAKFIPLALFIYHKSYFREHTDGIIYFAICGLTFGVGENILYTVSFGVQVGLARLILTPFLHAATTGILGYYLASLKISRPLKNRFVLACVLLPLMHGLYDFGLYSGVGQLIVVSLMITLLLSLGLFLYFMQANELDTSRLAFAHAAPANFCTACGRTNRGHTTFCEYCGHRL